MSSIEDPSGFVMNRNKPRQITTRSRYKAFCTASKCSCDICRPEILRQILNPTMTTEVDKAAAQNTQLIDQATLDTITDYSVWSEKGEEVKFGSLYAEKKTVVVFIRLSPSLVRIRY